MSHGNQQIPQILRKDLVMAKPKTPVIMTRRVMTNTEELDDYQSDSLLEVESERENDDVQVLPCWWDDHG